MSQNYLCSEERALLTRSMKKLLRYWYHRRFLLSQQTTQLMDLASDQENRRALGIVALLDVEAMTMTALLDVEAMTMTALLDVEELQYVRICHTYLDGFNEGRAGV